MITAGEVSDRLAQRAESVCAHLLPNGKRVGHEWVAGSVHGEAGNSLKVALGGAKSGVWKDFASDEAGDLLDLWAATRGVGISDALREARSYLGIVTPTFVSGGDKREYRKPARPAGMTKPRGAVLEYLCGRGITEMALSAYKVGANADDTEIVFPYLRGPDLINTKYLRLARVDGKKQIRQEKDAEPCLFGWQAVPERARTVIICEGELDAMTWWQAGFPALSVWSGAGNLQWIEHEWERLSRFDLIHLAFDRDEAGRAGAEATAQRLGLARCRIIETPYKDANECWERGLRQAEFREVVDSAVSLDPKELRSAGAYSLKVMDRFFPPEGMRLGWNTPFQRLNDRNIMFHPAEIVIVNGINGHGKTKFTSQVALQLLRDGGKVCLASMEVKPDNLLHSMTVQATGLKQPARAFIEHVQSWWDDKLWMFDAVGSVKADYLLDVFRYAHLRYGVDCFFIDSLAKCGMDEDDYNGQKRFVEALCDFKNECNVLIFLVTHSRKLDTEQRVVDKMDIKGTGAIADLADVVTTLWRNKKKELDPVSHADEPDARWYWQKNRNGDFESSVPLWYAQDAYQFRDQQTAHPKAYVHFIRDATPQEGELM